MLKSEDTLDAKGMAGKIGKTHDNKQEMCEDPPEFISENGDFNPDILNRSIVDNLSDIKAAHNDFMSQHSPNYRGKGKLTARSKANSNKSPYARAQRLRDDASVDSKRYVSGYHDDMFLDQNVYINAMGDKKLDKIDKHAIKHWRKTKKKKNRKNKLRRSNSGEINDLKRIVELYKLYGNDNLALVNPAENPGIL